MQRELFSTASQPLNGGAIFGLFLGVFYMYGAVYVIHSQYLNSLIFNTFSWAAESIKPLMFPLLHSILFLIWNFFCRMSSQSDLALSTVIGSDLFIIFAATGYISIYHNSRKVMNLDPWVTFQDGICYAIVLVCLVIFLMLQWMNLYSSVILFFLGIIYLFVVKFSDSIKETMQEWFSDNDEEHDYSSDEHFLCRKRRESSTNLKQKRCFDPNDPNLHKKLNRMEAILVMRFGTTSQDHPQMRIYTKFQKAVYTIIFGIRNLTKQEKHIRSDKYHDLYDNNRSRKKSERSSRGNLSSHRNQEARENSEPKIDQQVQEMAPLMDDKQANNVTVQRATSHKFSKLSKQTRIEESRYLAPISMVPPLHKVQRGIFYLYFPLFAILNAFPKVTISILTEPIIFLPAYLLSIACLIGISFLTDWWTMEIVGGTGIPLEIMGYAFTGIAFSIHFIEHVIKLVEQQTEIQVLQLFFQFAIIKLTLCVSIPHLIEVGVMNKTSLTFPSTFGFSLTVIEILGLVVLLMGIAVLSRFRLGIRTGSLLIGIYIAGSIAAITIMAVYNSS